MERNDWIESVSASVQALSRTVSGVNDPSLSINKPALVVESGMRLKKLASQNLRKALQYVWDMRDCGMDGTEMRHFIEEIARRLNQA